MSVLCLAPTTTLHKPTVRATKSVCQQGSLRPPGVFGDFSCIKCSGPRRGWRQTGCDRGHKKHMLSFLGFIQQRRHIWMYMLLGGTVRRKAWHLCAKIQEISPHGLKWWRSGKKSDTTWLNNRWDGGFLLTLWAPKPAGVISVFKKRKNYAVDQNQKLENHRKIIGLSTFRQSIGKHNKSLR